MSNVVSQTLSYILRGEYDWCIKSQFWREAIYTKSLNFGRRQYTPKVSVLEGDNIHQVSNLGEAINYIKSLKFGGRQYINIKSLNFGGGNIHQKSQIWGKYTFWYTLMELKKENQYIKLSWYFFYKTLCIRVFVKLISDVIINNDLLVGNKTITGLGHTFLNFKNFLISKSISRMYISVQ